MLRALRLEGVGRRFGAADALDRLDLTIERGEFIALLGPSGCGKSTALNCLAGLLPLTTGGIWQDDQRIDTLPPEKRGFGMVFQNYALFPHLSVRRNVALRPADAPAAARPRSGAAWTRRSRWCELEEHADKLPGQLSGGQQQRVAIARAIVLEPSLVLMDEPLSNLDAKLRLEMRTEIRRLHQSLGLTTVYVTHDQEEALALADRLVVLRAGRVQQIGTPEEVYTQPGQLARRRLHGLPQPAGAAGDRPGRQRRSTLEGPGIRLVGEDRRGSPGSTRSPPSGRRTSTWRGRIGTPTAIPSTPRRAWSRSGWRWSSTTAVSWPSEGFTEAGQVAALPGAGRASPSASRSS